MQEYSAVRMTGHISEIVERLNHRVEGIEERGGKIAVSHSIEARPADMSNTVPFELILAEFPDEPTVAGDAPSVLGNAVTAPGAETMDPTLTGEPRNARSGPDWGDPNVVKQALAFHRAARHY